MSRASTRLLALTAVALATGCTALDPNDEFSAVYFVKLESEPAQVAGNVQSIVSDFGIEPIHIYDSASEGFSVRLFRNGELITQIEDLAVVEYVQEDEKVDRLPPDQVNDDIVLGDDELTTGIERIGGPYPTVLDWSGVEVAVIDTGVDSSHPDLNVVAEADLVCDSGGGDCANGGDPQGHGTHVAGTIGAYADGDGVVGVAPGVPIHAVRVLGADGSGYVTDILAGLEYVLDNPEIRVVNMSLGGPAGSSFDAQLDDALGRLEATDVVVAIAAGNEDQDTANVVPAGLDRGIVVSAYDVSTGADNGFAWFSNYGDEVDIAAPGVGILSTWPGGGYKALDGTSMATPHVAGAAAAYLALNPNKSAAQVRDAIVNGGEDSYSGQGGDHPEPFLDFAELTGL